MFLKKVLLLIVMAFMPILSYSQEDDLFLSEEGKHLSFRDVAIDGSLKAFISQIKTKGFSPLYVSEDNSGAILDGKFIGKEVDLVIVTTPKTKTVWKVAVDFEDQISWYSLKSDYLDLKSSLTIKYGVPKSYEYFRSPYEEGDGYEMTAIYAEKCVYVSYFDVVENGRVIGSISLGIQKRETKGYIALHYEDATNAQKMRTEKNERVYDEL